MRKDAPRPAIRASDGDRELVVGLLREHAVEGRLALEELSERVGRAYEASTRDQLEELTRDLSVPERLAARRRATRLLLSFIGGPNKHGRWRLGRHLLVLTFIGGADLDLRQVEIDGTSTTITILSFIGGADLHVPAGVEVELSGFSAIGGTTSRDCNRSGTVAPRSYGCAPSGSSVGPTSGISRAKPGSSRRPAASSSSRRAGPAGKSDRGPNRVRALITIAGFRREGSKMGGISLGGILVIIGIVLLILGYTILGIIIALVGLLAFGGFARGRWY